MRGIFEMREKILGILLEINPDIKYEEETRLIDDELLDSFSIIELITNLMDEFEIELDADDIEPENLNSLDAICELVKSRQGK